MPRTFLELKKIMINAIYTSKSFPLYNSVFILQYLQRIYSTKYGI